MALMVMAAICPKCSEIRAKSRFTFQRGDAVPPPKPEDFIPIAGQEPFSAAEPRCTVCDATLVIRSAPVDVTNGHSNPRPSTPSVQDEGAVTVLFAAQAGEEVKEMRNIGPDKILVVTTRRIMTIDINRLVEEMP